MLVVVVLMIEALAVDTLLGYEVECSNQVTEPGLVFVRKSRFLPGLSVSVAEIVAVVSVVAEAVVVVVVAEAAVVVVVVVVVAVVVVVVDVAEAAAVVVVAVDGGT